MTPTPEAKKAGGDEGSVKEAEWDAGLGLTTYGAEVKAGHWYPVWVEIRANKAAVKGLATLSQPGNPLRVEIPIDVSKGARKIYRASFRVQQPRDSLVPSVVDVQLRAEPLGEAGIPLTVRFAQPGDRHVLALCEQDGAFNFLSRRGGEDGRQGSVLGRQAVIYSRAELLPDDPNLLQSLDAMIIDTPQVRRLGEAQWAAIKGWVAQGGQLLLAVGRQQPFIQQSPLKDPFGVKLSAAESVTLKDVCAGSPLAETQQISTATAVLAAWPEPPPGGWDEVWVGDAKRAFLAGKRFGNGMFSFCAAALDAPVIDALKRLSPAPDSLLPLEQPRPASPLAAFAAAQERNLGLSLQRGFAMTLAGIGWVIGFLLAYNLIAMPLNWWACRRLGRPGLFWPLLIALAGAFAWYGYKSGAERQQQNFQVNELTFITRAEPGAPALARSCTTLFTPRRIRGDLPAAGRVFLSRLPLADRESLEPVTLGFEGVTSIRNAVLFPWTVLNLRAQFTLPPEGAVKIEGRMNDGGEETTTTAPGPLVLDNRTSLTFRRWWIMRGTEVWAGEGAVQAGGRVSNATIKRLAYNRGAALDALVWPAVNELFPGTEAGAAPTPVPTPSPRRPAAAPLAQAGPAGNDRKLDRVYFLGVADGVCSPLAKSFGGQKAVGAIFYEQPLPGDSVATPATAKSAAGPVAVRDWAPGEWTLQAVSIGSDPVRLPDEPLALKSRKETLKLPLNKCVLKFTPERPLARADRIPPSIGLAFGLGPITQTGFTWFDPQTQFTFELASVPMEVYNFRQRDWKPLTYPAGQVRPIGPGAVSLALKIEPGGESLDPRDSSLYLRMLGEPGSILYRPLNAPADQQFPVNGKKLFEPQYGIQLPETLADMNAPAPPQQGIQFPPPRGIWISGVVMSCER